MYDNPFEFFDKILTILSKNYGKTYSVLELTEILLPLPKDVIFVDKAKHDNKEIVLNALMFLNSEKLVALKDDKEVFINTKGLIKIKTKGFVKESEEIKWDRYYRIWNNLLTPLIALAALALSIITLTLKKPNEVPNHNCHVDYKHKQEQTQK